MRLTTSDTGAALSSIDDDPWGAVERGTVARFGFTGELQQGSTVHLRARWYNATSGSFASVDPYAGDPASPASLAPYMYAYNQPTGFTDPSGRCIAEGHGDNTCEQQRSFEERLVSAYGKPIYEDVTFRNHRGADGLIAFFDANPQEALAYAAHPTSLQQSIEAAAYKGDAYVGDPYTVERLINITLGSWAKDYAQRYPGCDVGGNALLIAGLGGLGPTEFASPLEKAIAARSANLSATNLSATKSVGRLGVEYEGAAKFWKDIIHAREGGETLQQGHKYTCVGTCVRILGLSKKVADVLTELGMVEEGVSLIRLQSELRKESINSVIHPYRSLGNANRAAFAIKSMLDKGHSVIMGFDMFTGREFESHAIVVSSMKYTENIGWDIIIKDPAIGREVHIDEFGWASLYQTSSFIEIP